MSDQPPLIYVLDDDVAICIALKALIQSFGWRVRCFSAASELLRSDLETRNVCLLLDYCLGDCTGLDVLNSLRSSGYDLPAVVMTAHRQAGFSAWIKSNGVRNMLRKPFHDEALKAAIESTMTFGRLAG